MIHLCTICGDAIKEIPSFLYRTCIEPVSGTEDSRRQEYILNILLAASILMLFVLDGMILYHTLLFGHAFPQISFEEFLTLPVFFILLYILSRRGKFILSSYLLIATLFVSNSYAAYVWGDNLPVVLLAYAFIVCTSGILIGTLFGFAMTAISTCVLGVIWHLHIHRIIIVYPKYPGEDDIIVFAIFYFLIMAVSWLSNREIEKSLFRARQSEKALKEERDLLEIRIAERTEQLRLIQFEKVEHIGRLAEFGQLASGVFHDVLNLLNAISLRIEERGDKESLLITAYSTTRQIKQFMCGVQRQLGEGNVRDSFSLVEAIEQAIQLVDYKAKSERVRVVFLRDTYEPFIYFGIPFKFHQVMINLLTNAIDSYQPANKKTTGCRNITIQISRRGRVYVVSVEDKGCGIPANAQAKIFEPFFTTKEEIRGTGIGLASIKKIITDDFRGTIEVHSAEHVGSIFVVTFPIIEPPPSNQNPDSSQGDL